MDGLEDAIHKMEGDMIVARDFNTKALKWGMPEPDCRGKQLVQMSSRLDLVVLNTGRTSTFR